MGAQYCFVREPPDQLAVPPPPTPPSSWPARNPVSTFNSFTVLAEIDDATAWPSTEQARACLQSNFSAPPGHATGVFSAPRPVHRHLLRSWQLAARGPLRRRPDSLHGESCESTCGQLRGRGERCERTRGRPHEEAAAQVRRSLHKGRGPAAGRGLGKHAPRLPAGRGGARFRRRGERLTATLLP